MLSSSATDYRTIIEQKIDTFLKCLGESKQQYKDGLCNAFAFMNFRADIIGHIDDHLKRLHQLINLKDEELQHIALLYKSYKTFRLTRIEKMNQKISNIEREQFIEKQINEFFSPIDLISIRAAEDLYIYINNLIASFDPGEDLHLTINGEQLINQNDFIDILKILPPDELINFDHSFIEKKLSVGFNFTETELIEVIDKSVLNGDYVALSTTDHTMYLSKDNYGILHFYDPVEVPLEPNNAKTLVSIIKKEHFLKLSRYANIFPVTLNIFAKSNTINEKSRPTQSELIRPLCENNQRDINAESWDGTTALMIAAQDGLIDTLALLINAKAKLNKLDDDGSTALFHAVTNGHIEAVKLLIAANAQVNKCGKGQATPLLMALQKNYSTIAKLLIEANDADINTPIKYEKNTTTPLLFSIQHNQQNIVALLIQAKADVNKSCLGTSPLFLAVQLNKADIVELLIDANADVNKPSRFITPFYMAVHGGRIDIVKIFIAKCKHLNLNASIKLDLSILKEEALKRNRNGELDLYLKNRNLEKETVLVGFQPIHAAACFGYLDIIKILVKAGIDPQKTTTELGVTALGLAKIMGHEDIVQVLSSKKSEYKAPSIYQDVHMSQYLLYNQAEPNQNKRKASNDATDLNTASKKTFTNNK